MTVPVERRRWIGGDLALLVAVIVLAVLTTAAFVASGIVLVGNARAAEARIGGSYVLAELLEGDCVGELPQFAPEEFTVVDCAAPHAAEFVFATDQSAAIDQNLGDRALAALADTYCDTTFRYRINLDESVATLPDADVVGYVGTRATFAGGARFHCFLYNTTGEPLVGRYYVDDAF